MSPLEPFCTLKVPFVVCFSYNWLPCSPVVDLVLYCCKALSWALDVSLVVVPDMFLSFFP